MINDVAILYGFMKTLKENFPTNKILADGNKSDIRKPEDIKKPTFYVNVRPLSSDTFKRYSRELYNITIDYIEENTLTLEQKLKMKTNLNKIFNMGIKIDNTYILFQNKTWNLDDELSLNLTINFVNNLDYKHSEDYYTELMNELFLKEE